VNAETGMKSDILIQVPNSSTRSDAAQAVKKMRIMEEDEDGMDEE
jgi:ATP-dependent Clp protease ATP-binding subunit ClpB